MPAAGLGLHPAGVGNRRSTVQNVVVQLPPWVLGKEALGSFCLTPP